ncbi:hypothetical protein TNIN_371441 [Trichonephila inaurata madagascariensis]|uniref:Uncharacterized protein n=1 Tax=Trichonephila inaurata madagascariensis TaxID=2747483 RepID=A0A8X7C420_9ARAC|nr:hypothetical protein TNIN_371441 [Trichonephila inaurata madagascariensis]
MSSFQSTVGWDDIGFAREKQKAYCLYKCNPNDRDCRALQIAIFSSLTFNCLPAKRKEMKQNIDIIN